MKGPYLIAIITVLLATTFVVVGQHFVSPVSRITLLFAGDLMQHESQLNAARQGDGTYSYSGCYRHIRSEVSAADIAIANLETVIGRSGFSGYPSFCAPDSFLHAAKNAGFDILLFANNHCLDRGKRGALYTMQMMDSLGITHCGVYRDSADRAQRYPLLVHHKGFRIAILNYTYGTNGIEPQAPLIVNYIDDATIANDIQKARSMRPDAIIACMHWGDEYVSLPPKRVRTLTDRLLEQGVDHVIGNHPHVLQPMETRNDTLRPGRQAIVYSLGNLISGMYARGRDGGALVRIKLKKFCETTLLDSLQYALTWVARPHRDGVENFTIIPAATPPFEPDGTTRTKIDEFVNDSRTLFSNHNKGNVTEYFIEPRQKISE